LVVAGEFDATKRTHRKALLEQDLPETDHADHVRLVNPQDRYRSVWVNSEKLQLAKLFASVANG
jgi:hypothetical protein